MAKIPILEKKGIDENDVIKDYIQGLNITNCAKKWRLSYNNLINIFNINNIEIRSAETTKKYFFNDDYFEKIDTEAKAYFLGLIVADGNVHKRKFSISLQEADKIILEKLKREIGFIGPLYKTEKKNNNCHNSYVLSITSSKMVEDLSKYGVVPNKSLKTYFPDIPEGLYRHFIRGVFDGDGCISKDKTNKGCFNIIGNIKLITRIQEILIHKCNLNKTKLSKVGKIISMNSRRNVDVLNIREWLYKDATIFFQRKYDLYYSIREERLTRKSLKLINTN